VSYEGFRVEPSPNLFLPVEANYDGSLLGGVGVMASELEAKNPYAHALYCLSGY